MGTFKLKVNYLPPIKDSALSILNKSHRCYRRVESLQKCAKEKINNKELFRTKLGISIENYGCHGDADNIIGGIFDSLQGIVYNNDSQFVEVNYKLLDKKESCKYKVIIWEIN